MMGLKMKVVIVIIGHGGGINDSGGVGDRGVVVVAVEVVVVKMVRSLGCVWRRRGRGRVEGGNIVPELSPWWASGALPTGATVVFPCVHDAQKVVMTPQAKSMPTSFNTESRFVPKTNMYK